GFRTLDLEIDPRALIPRPETEGLVELVLRAMRETGNGKGETWGAVADIGTGCGCIALALAVEGAFERVIAVERSRDAAALARENVALLQPPLPVEVREGDLLGPPAGERSEEHTSELQSRGHLVCRLLLEKKKRGMIVD